jgi:hypothetical protein
LRTEAPQHGDGYGQGHRRSDPADQQEAGANRQQGTQEPA